MAEVGRTLIVGEQLVFEQFGVTSGSHENNGVRFDPVDQEKVAANVAFAMVGPVTLQRMISPFGAQWAVVGDQQKHCFFEAVQVESPRT